MLTRPCKIRYIMLSLVRSLRFYRVSPHRGPSQELCEYNHLCLSSLCHRSHGCSHLIQTLLPFTEPSPPYYCLIQDVVTYSAVGWTNLLCSLWRRSNVSFKEYYYKVCLLGNIVCMPAPG